MDQPERYFGRTISLAEYTASLSCCPCLAGLAFGRLEPRPLRHRPLDLLAYEREEPAGLVEPLPGGGVETQERDAVGGAGLHPDQHRVGLADVVTPGVLVDPAKVVPGAGFAAAF